MKRKIAPVCLSVIILTSYVIIIIEMAPVVESSNIIYVDDVPGGSPSEDFTTIQEAVDAAQPGDTVFVYAGTYREDVVIDKTINLTGENRDTTIINSTDKMGIYVTNANFVNISGFTVVNGSWAGIRLMPSSNSIVENIHAKKNMYGIQIVQSNNIIVRNNIASNNSDYHGIYLDESANITVKNNLCLNNAANGILVYDSSWNNIIIANNCSNNSFGISVDTFSENNLIIGNNVTLNNNYGLGVFSNNNTFEENIIISNNVGVRTNGLIGDTNKLINSTIISSATNDISRGFADKLIILNTTFNKSRVSYQGTLSILYVQWYLHVNVIDYLGNPVPNINVKIEDNKNNSYHKIFTTDVNGFLRWLTVTEYIEQDINGDTIGEKTFHTPHQIIAWNDTLVGYALPNINETKTITIVLYNGTLMDLEPGWNLISLPRIQSNTNLVTILQSIEGQYDAVQRYKATDTNDPWKHLRISKPSSLNDLDELDPYMGFWIHITDPGGTALAVFGDEFTTDQIIPLYKGWNHVGYPSSITRVPDFGLPSSVDMIQWYNGSSGIWECWDPGSFSSDNLYNINPGHGLWIHCTQAYDEWILEHNSPPQVDWIEIVDTAGVGATVIPNFSIDVDQTTWGYAAAYNITTGYLGDIIVTWSVQNIGGANASTNPIIWDSSGFYSGDSGGTAIWTADDGNGHTDSITITINSP